MFSHLHSVVRGQPEACQGPSTSTNTMEPRKDWAQFTHPTDSTPDEALISFKYLNQGGANVVFAIIPSQRRREQTVWAMIDAAPNPQVLRVDKGLEKTLCCAEVIAGFNHDIRPLFMPRTRMCTLAVNDMAVVPTQTTVQEFTLPDGNLTEHLMDHDPVALSSAVMADLIARCKDIRPREGPTRCGILLPDMSPVEGESITLEIKPKWLAQSPTAPSDAVRCRTCALQLVKAKDPKQYICPMNWIHGDYNSVYPWVRDRVVEQLGNPEQPHAASLTDHITSFLTVGAGKDIMQRLQLLQSQLDVQGVLTWKSIHPSVKSQYERNLRLAMTLRDCSMFIKAVYRTRSPDLSLDQPIIDCKLGDLDFKSIDKRDDWWTKENGLLVAGAYTLRAKDDSSRYPTCLYLDQTRG
jgi:inositol-pentakisphosphate 2-kinase